MAKVHNGWQLHDISELENMTSNKASPIPTVSDAQPLYGRHFPTNIPADYLKFIVQLSEPAVAGPKLALFSLLFSATTFQNTSEYRWHENVDRSAHPNKVGAGHDSCWRNHKAGGASRPIEAYFVSPSLAPPADIIAHPSRRSKQSPPLRTHDLSTDSDPVTPQPRTESKIRTPSQQAEVEKDAGNSAIHVQSG